MINYYAGVKPKALTMPGRHFYHTALSLALVFIFFLGRKWEDGKMVRGMIRITGTAPRPCALRLPWCITKAIWVFLR